MMTTCHSKKKEERMPSDRFLKLEKEKQERIIRAARREFSHVPYEQASINKIIRYAGISRGSFYTYFEDKEDLLAYIFQEEERLAAAYLQERMEEYEGDIWLAVHSWLRRLVEAKENFLVKESLRILSYAGIPRRLDLINRKDAKREYERVLLDWLLRRTSPASLGNAPEEERIVLFKAMFSSALITLLRIYTYPESMKAELREFDILMGILKRGCMSADAQP
ncbi:transcriptional regulator, TetR family [Oribacterium sp. oral taxon 078 str. F0262]|nr:transcriptional regulator, TetR family [Oribacterium sp. oral taxon 078 str. F0262]